MPSEDNPTYLGILAIGLVVGIFVGAWAFSSHTNEITNVCSLSDGIIWVEIDENITKENYTFYIYYIKMSQCDWLNRTGNLIGCKDFGGFGKFGKYANITIDYYTIRSIHEK